MKAEIQMRNIFQIFIPGDGHYMENFKEEFKNFEKKNKISIKKI